MRKIMGINKGKDKRKRNDLLLYILFKYQLIHALSRRPSYLFHHQVLAPACCGALLPISEIAGWGHLIQISCPDVLLRG